MHIIRADNTEIEINDAVMESEYYQKAKKHLKSVLVVDDILYVVKSISRILMNQGYLVHTATTGKEAIEKFKEFTPNLVTIDQKLPDMTGFQLVEKIRNLEGGDKAKLVFISAVHAREEIRTIMSLGIDNYLLKPFKREKLIEVVKKLLG